MTRSWKKDLQSLAEVIIVAAVEDMRRVKLLSSLCHRDELRSSTSAPFLTLDSKASISGLLLARRGGLKPSSAKRSIPQGSDIRLLPASHVDTRSSYNAMRNLTTNEASVLIQKTVSFSRPWHQNSGSHPRLQFHEPAMTKYLSAPPCPHITDIAGSRRFSASATSASSTSQSAVHRRTYIPMRQF